MNQEWEKLSLDEKLISLREEINTLTNQINQIFSHIGNRLKALEDSDKKSN